MKHSLKTGFSFGLTSGIITTLGLIVGLHSGTNSRIAVIGGILIIAIADAFSDSLGIHVSEESECKHSDREIWESTIATFLTKFAVAITFIVPILILPLAQAIVASIAWGLSLLSVFSYFIARDKGIKPWGIIAEHLVIAIIVVILTNYVGAFIGARFS
jgi:VIT1/CCC1 family predicted Fe2+/Mn2+ transporter